MQDAAIYQTISTILARRQRLSCSPSTEAEVGYAICDPIMSHICDRYHYSLKIEESISDNMEEVEDEIEEANILLDIRCLWEKPEPVSQQSDSPPAKRKCVSIGSAISEKKQSRLHCLLAV